MIPTLEAVRERFRARRTENITESVIREMTRLALQHKAVNLAQGFPDFPAPDVLKNAARALTQRFRCLVLNRPCSRVLRIASR